MPHLWCVWSAVVLSSVVSMYAQPLQRFAYEEPHMGTAFRVVLYASDSTTAQQAATAAFARVAALNQALSNYIPDSELMQLAGTAGLGRAVPVSDDLWIVLAAARRLADETNGAFDVTVGPLAKLWRKAFRRKAMPETDALAEAKSRVGYRHMVLDEEHQTVALHMPDMVLDLGGLAKGYAVDEALGVLKSYGVMSALVDGGGDIALGDAPPGALGWRISIAALNADGALSEEEHVLANKAVATSGDTYRFLQVGHTRYSHLIDPHSGLGATHQALVTVVAPSGMEADALASAISVMGWRASQPLLKNRPDVMARWVQRHNEQYTQVESPAFVSSAQLRPD